MRIFRKIVTSDGPFRADIGDLLQVDITTAVPCALPKIVPLIHMLTIDIVLTGSLVPPILLPGDGDGFEFTSGETGGTTWGDPGQTWLTLYANAQSNRWVCRLSSGWTPAPA